MRKMIFLLIVFSISSTLFSQTELILHEPQFSGISVLPVEINYSHPIGQKGWYYNGLIKENDSAYDLSSFYGIRFDMITEKPIPVNVECQLIREPINDRNDLLAETKAHIQLLSSGQQSITIPLKDFDFNKGQSYFLKYIKSIKLKISSVNNEKENIQIKNVRFIKANSLLLTADIYSRPLDSSYKASYPITITNTSEITQSYNISLVKNGWEGMNVDVSLKHLSLRPQEKKEITVNVSATDYLPSGAHEKHTLRVTPLTGNVESTELELMTVVPVLSPLLIHNKAGWNEVREKIKKHDWAKAEFDEYIRTADQFVVPEIKKGTMSDQGTEGLVRAYIEGALVRTAIAYYLAGENKYGEKVAELLRRISDPELGYPRTRHLTFQGIPQEGGTMEGMIWAYDLIKESDLLSDKDKEQIEATFRLFCNNVIDMLIGDGGISNWTVFNVGPAAQAALLLHDMDLFNKLMYGPCGIVDQFRYGTMDDGWWYEVSLSYNLGAASCFTQLALAAGSFGIDLINYQFPSSLTRNVGLRPFEYENYLGMAFGKFGPLKHNTIDIKRMWDGILVYPDYRGVMFGMGDGHEQQVSGSHFELAYYVFRDARYASLLKRVKKRDLIYGVAELPEETPDLSSVSGYSDNAGIAVLRSQTKERKQQDRIQVGVKYGTHGSYHGHFDRISLLSLMRYGRSFYNPETSWFGYGSYMYKWWVQPSLAHNMVVVDGMQQEPTSCEQLLFHSGEMMQAIVVSTDARWSNPPYMGGYDHIEDIRVGKSPYVPIPDNHPEVGALGEYSEPVHQRRLTVVTDDYVLLADYLKGNNEHTFDNLIHLRGAKSTDGLLFQTHKPQFDTNPLSSGQFITNVNQYRYTDGAKIESVHHFAPKGENGKNRVMNNWETGGQNHFYNEQGDLHLDVHSVWPSKADILIGDYAEDWWLGKKMEYTLLADGKKLASGAIGTWILGKIDINAELRNKKELRIEIETDRRNDRKKTLFLAGAVLVTDKGNRIPLSSMKASSNNIATLPEKGKDYEGGPVKIAGTPYTDFIGVEPENIQEMSSLTYDLTGLNIIRLEGVLGGDYPVGNEEQLRKVVSVHSKGKEAQFVSVIEPYERESLVKKVKALSASEIEIELKDGRIQLITFDNFYGTGKNISVSIKELKGKQMLRNEKTKSDKNE